MNRRFLERVKRGLRRRLRGSPLLLRHRSEHENIFHCCVQKTASSWLAMMLRDTRTYRYSGFDLVVPPVDHADLWNKRSAMPLAPGRLVSPMYIAWEGYASQPKPDRHRAFFVIRDPRDIIVSWYFSARFSHPVEGNPPLSNARAELSRRDKEEGLAWSIAYLARYGLYHAMESFAEGSTRDPRVLLLRFEDLTGAEQPEHFQRLLDHCDIRMPAHVRDALLRDWAFKQLARKGPQSGDEPGHYRKGAAGDWRNHFTDRHEQLYWQCTGDLTRRLGYS